VRIRLTPVTLTTGLAATALIVAGVTDLTVENGARQRVVGAATCRLHPAGPVTAELTDTFAGLQVLGGDLGTVHVTADGVQQGGTTMNIDAVLHNVTTGGATDGGTATATVPYPALQQRLGPALAGMTVGTDGTGLTLSGPVGSLGLPVTVETSVTTTANSLVVTPTGVVLLGQTVPVGALSSFPGGAGLAAGMKPHTVALPNLPVAAQVVGARPGATGLSLLLSIPHTTGLAQPAKASTGPSCSSPKA
jgi:hypothetical protein